MAYSRFAADEVLEASPAFLAKLTALLDEGPLAGHADLDALREINPAMQSVREWLAGTGRDSFVRCFGYRGHMGV